MRRYTLKECFYSLQGEGVRAGTANIFVRFAGCNLACRRETHGFDCDTDFIGGEHLSADQLLSRIEETAAGCCEWILFTGGEPALQLDAALVGRLKQAGYKLAIETNGTIALPPGLDWVCVSPKGDESELRQRVADEVKYVVADGAPLPRTTVQAAHHLLSPAFEVASKVDPTRPGQVSAQTLRWCIDLCLANPPWRLSVQQHKHWEIR